MVLYIAISHYYADLLTRKLTIVYGFYSLFYNNVVLQPMLVLEDSVYYA